MRPVDDPHASTTNAFDDPVSVDLRKPGPRRVRLNQDGGLFFLVLRFPDAIEIGPQLVHGLVAGRGILLQRLPDDASDHRGGLRERLRILLEDPAHDHRQRTGGEGLAAGDQVVAHRTEREDVGPVVDDLAANLFGRHVVGRAEDETAACEFGAGDASQTEVQNLDPSVVGKEQVARLEVAVYDGSRVCERKPCRYPSHDLHPTLDRYALFILQHLDQIAPGEKLHGDIRAPALLAEVVYLDDVGVIQVCRRTSLSDETFPGFRLFRQLGHDHLQRHQAVELGITGAIHHAHTALADPVEQLVAADTLRAAGPVGF